MAATITDVVLFLAGTAMTDVTLILSRIESGDPTASEQLLPLVYDELRRLATQRLSQEQPGQTLQATALVHEAYLRLVDGEQTQPWNSRGHFLAPRPRPCDGFSSTRRDTSVVNVAGATINALS